MSETKKGKDVTIKVQTAMTANAKLLPPRIVITYEIDWKKDWLKLLLVALGTIAGPLLPYVIKGCWGMIIGILISIVIFFLGIWGTTRKVKKIIPS